MIQCSENPLHIFCYNCTEKYINICIVECRNGLTCIMGKDACGGKFDINDLEKFMSEKHIDNLKNIIEISDALEIAKAIENYQICPSCKKYGCIVDGLDHVLCQRCGKEWCTKCRRQHKEGVSCWIVTNENDNEAIRNIIEDLLTDVLYRRCSFCEAKYIKDNGCNLVICPACEISSCFICGERIDKDSNGKAYWHFKGSGSEGRYSTCVLYNDGNGESDDQGNFEYYEKCIKDKLRIILNDNVPTVSNKMIKELHKYGIRTNIDNYISKIERNDIQIIKKKDKSCTLL